MNTAFTTENERKDNLFVSWNKYFETGCHQFNRDEIDEVFEGMATVSEISKNFLGLHLEDGRKIRYIRITPQIGVMSARLDIMFVVLARVNKKWYPVDIVLIYRFRGPKFNQIHGTVNPLFGSRSFLIPSTSTHI